MSTPTPSGERIAYIPEKVTKLTRRGIKRPLDMIIQCLDKDRQAKLQCVMNDQARVLELALMDITNDIKDEDLAQIDRKIDECDEIYISLWAGDIDTTTFRFTFTKMELVTCGWFSNVNQAAEALHKYKFNFCADTKTLELKLCIQKALELDMTKGDQSLYHRMVPIGPGTIMNYHITCWKMNHNRLDNHISDKDEILYRGGLIEDEEDEDGEDDEDEDDEDEYEITITEEDGVKDDNV
jgi:hypothetical protein